MNPRRERRAEAFVMTSTVIEGGFPIMANHAVSVFPAMYFAGVSAMVGGLAHVLILLKQGKLFQRIPLRTWIDILGVSLCNSVFALFFIFLGTRYTSGINTALLLQSEMLFSFFIFTFLFGERYTKRQMIGALIVLIGTLLVLYNGSFALNRGDILIIFGTLFFPFGNVFAKRALKVASSGFVLFIRNLLGSIVFLTLSFSFENIGFGHLSLLRENIWLVLLYGLVILVISKLCWYEGFKELSLSKSISMILSYPAFSLVFAALFLHEIPTLYQFGGFTVTLWGLSFLIKRTAVLSPPPDL